MDMLSQAPQGPRVRANSACPGCLQAPCFDSVSGTGNGQRAQEGKAFAKKAMQAALKEACGNGLDQVSEASC